MKRESPVYDTYEENGVQMIRRNKYPRFTARITFDSPASDFSDVELLDDDADYMDVDKAMRKASEFLIKVLRYGKNKEGVR